MSAVQVCFKVILLWMIFNAYQELVELL